MPRLGFLPLLLAAAAFPALAAIDPTLLALVPPGAKIVSGIDFDRARGSDFGQFLIARMNAAGNQDFEQFVAQTGFDPRHDVQQIIFASTGPGNQVNGNNFAVLARGNFDEDRIKATAKTNGLAPQTFQGVNIFLNTAPAHDAPAFAFLGDGVGLLGDVDTVKQIISNRARAASLDPALQAVVSKIGTDNDAWFVSFISGGFLANHMNAQINGDQPNQEGKPSLAQAQALQSIQQSSGGIQFGATIRVSFDAVTRSPQDATSLADVVRFFASMVQMERQKDPRATIAASAFDNMNLATDGDAMHLTISFPEKSLEQLVDTSAGASSGHHHAQ